MSQRASPDAVSDAGGRPAARSRRPRSRRCRARRRCRRSGRRRGRTAPAPRQIVRIDLVQRRPGSWRAARARRARRSGSAPAARTPPSKPASPRAIASSSSPSATPAGRRGQRVVDVVQPGQRQPHVDLAAGRADRQRAARRPSVRRACRRRPAPGARCRRRGSASGRCARRRRRRTPAPRRTPSTSGRRPRARSRRPPATRRRGRSDHRAAAPASRREATAGSSALRTSVTSSGNSAIALRQIVGDGLDFAVAVELVAEEVGEDDGPRAARRGRPAASSPRPPRRRRRLLAARGIAPLHVAASASAAATPRIMFEPSRLATGRSPALSHDAAQHPRRRRLAVRAGDQHAALGPASRPVRRRWPGSMRSAIRPGSAVPPPTRRRRLSPAAVLAATMAAVRRMCRTIEHAEQ